MASSYWQRLQTHCSSQPTAIAIINSEERTSYDQLQKRVIAHIEYFSAQPSTQRRFFLHNPREQDTIAGLIAASVCDKTLLIGLNHLAPLQQQQLILQLAITPYSTPCNASKSAITSTLDTLGQQPFYASFTSGSSAAPKCFARHESSWLASFAVFDHRFDFQHLSALDLGADINHSLGLFFAMWGLYHGKTIYTKKSPTTSSQRLWIGTPTALHIQRKHLIKNPPSHIMLGGASVAPAILLQWKKQLPNTRFLGFYGASELSFVSFIDYHTDPFDSVGRMIENLQFKILEQELYIKTAQAFSGYLDATVELPAPVEDWISVGDKAHIDEQGYIYLHGRSGRVINSGGIIIELDPIEAVLAQHPKVEQVAVISIADTRRGHRLIATIVGSATLPELRLALRSRFGKSVDIHGLRRVEALALSNNAKVDYRRIKQDYLDEHP